MSVKECPIPILGRQSCEHDSARYVPNCFPRRILTLASFYATPNSISTSPYHIRPFEVAFVRAWSQETGACAGSVRYPTVMGNDEKCLLSRVVLRKNSQMRTPGEMMCSRSWEFRVPITCDYTTRTTFIYYAILLNDGYMSA